MPKKQKQPEKAEIKKAFSDEFKIKIRYINHLEHPSPSYLELGFVGWFNRVTETLEEIIPDCKIKLAWAVPTGFSDWDGLYHKFCIFLLEDVCKNTDNPLVKKTISDIIKLHKEKSTDKEKWKELALKSEEIKNDTDQLASFNRDNSIWSAHYALSAANMSTYILTFDPRSSYLQSLSTMIYDADRSSTYSILKDEDKDDKSKITDVMRLKTWNHILKKLIELLEDAY